MLELLLATQIATTDPEHLTNLLPSFLEQQHQIIYHSPTQKTINKELQQIVLEEEIRRFSPLLYEEFKEKNLFVLLQEQPTPQDDLNAHYFANMGFIAQPDSKNMGYGVIIIGCTMNYDFCLTNATAHELAHHIDNRDLMLDTLIDERLELPDAQSFNNSLAEMDFVYQELKNIYSLKSKMNFCTFLKTASQGLDVLSEEFSLSFFDQTRIDFFKEKYSSCEELTVIQQAEVLSDEAAFLDFFRAVYHSESDAQRPSRTPIPDSLTSFPQDYVSDYSTLKELIYELIPSNDLPENLSQQLLLFATTISIRTPSLGATPHDMLFEERFAATIDSLVNQYIGPVVWNNMSLTLTPNLLDYLEDYEYRGEKIFSEHVARYRELPGLQEYWATLPLSCSEKHIRE